MSLDLATQHDYATAQTAFRGKVQAAMVSAAIAAFSAAPITGTGTAGATQAQRITLANSIVKSAATGLDTFCWVVVTRPAFAAVDDLSNEIKISNAVMGAFDAVAAQLIPAGGP